MILFARKNSVPFGEKFNDVSTKRRTKSLFSAFSSRAQIRRRCITFNNSTLPLNRKFAEAISLIDEQNSQDPNHELVDGQPVPRELLYSQRLTAWVLRLHPSASEALLLAARSQHICRWKIPRSQYPATRAGYHQWKNDLKSFHANTSAQILQSLGYDLSTIDRVRFLNLKQGFPDDAETRILEDALCLMFLEYQFAELAQKAEAEKVVNALRKSWAKMTLRAREAALSIAYNPVQKVLLDRALASRQAPS